MMAIMLLANEAFLKLAGSARSLLTVERPALNFVQTLSAVATKTAPLCQRACKA